MVKQSSTLPEPFLGATDDGIHGADFLADLEQNLHRGRLEGRRRIGDRRALRLAIARVESDESAEGVGNDEAPIGELGHSPGIEQIRVGVRRHSCFVGDEVFSVYTARKHGLPRAS